jgi:hypothetical protein
MHVRTRTFWNGSVPRHAVVVKAITIVDENCLTVGMLHTSDAHSTSEIDD